MKRNKKQQTKTLAIQKLTLTNLKQYQMKNIMGGDGSDTNAVTSTGAGGCSYSGRPSCHQTQ
jgi:hypothetical protein